MRSALPAALLLATTFVLAGCSGLPGFGPERTEWAFDKTGLDALRGRGLDGSGVTVAILDTGLDDGHPAFDGARIIAWTDLAGGRAEPYDEEGHGTHVAGLVVGQGPARGGAPGADLIVVKVFGPDGTSSDGQVAEGIRFAVEHGADVIGLSLGGGTFPVLGTATEDAARSAIAEGVLVVAAAGNEGPDNRDVSSPASVAGVIAVAAVGRSLEVAEFSSRGSSSQPLIGGLGGTFPRQAPDQKPEVSAPGVGIVSAWTGDRYAEASGTSAAVPFVVSALALLLQAHPQADPQDAEGVETVKRWLMESAGPVPGAQEPHDRAAGYGYLRADALVDAAG